jgi:hypothetical protein
LLGANGGVTGPFVAYNNVDSPSNGPWPDGTFSYVGYNSHPALSDPNSEYGAHGILIFDVPNRQGMGVHSGRLSVPDGLGRSGPLHCTLGCIRTTDEAMAAFLGVIGSDPMNDITVVTPPDGDASHLAAFAKSRIMPQQPVKSRKAASGKKVRKVNDRTRGAKDPTANRSHAKTKKTPKRKAGRQK